MGAQCEPNDEGEYYCNSMNFDNRYYKFELRVTLTGAILAMIGSFGLAVLYGDNKMPFFIQGICVCAVFATLCTNFLETMGAREFEAYTGYPHYRGE